MNEIVLTAEQEEAARRIEDVMRAGMGGEVRQLARRLASAPNRELLGGLEFELREAMHRVAARGIDAALDERKKGGTKGPA